LGFEIERVGEKDDNLKERTSGEAAHCCDRETER
jgi:hypothetical protein